MKKKVKNEKKKQKSVSVLLSDVKKILKYYATFSDFVNIKIQEEFKNLGEK